MTEEIITGNMAQPGAWAIIHCAARGTFLLGRRSSLVSKAGAWNFFGGRIDAGEEPGHALIRELEEEAGLRVSRDRLIELGCLTGLRSEPGRETLRLLHYFLLLLDEEISPQLNYEHSEAGWFSLNALPDRFNRPTAVALQNGLLEQALAAAERLLPPNGGVPQG